MAVLLSAWDASNCTDTQVVVLRRVDVARVQYKLALVIKLLVEGLVMVI
jgi:hypothetical protein